MPTFKAALLSIIVVLGGTASVSASDFCFDTGEVIKAFSLPGHGTCKSYHGIYPNLGAFANGMACGSSDNDHIIFTETAIDSGGVTTSAYIMLTRSSGSGFIRECNVDTGPGSSGCSAFPIHRVDCTPPTVPVP